MSGTCFVYPKGRPMPSFRFLVLATAAVGGVLLTSARADAHAMHAKVKVEGDSVRLDAYHDEEFPAEFADVTVTDAAGAVVLTGKTDETGVWTFPRPKPGKYAVTVRKPDGHVATTEFEVAGPAGPDAPTTFGGPRLNKWLGLSAGVLILLCISGASWMRRRRVRRLE